MKKAQVPVPKAIPAFGDTFPMQPGSIIMSGVQSGPQLSSPTTHPEVLPSSDRSIQDCHLSTFICLSTGWQSRRGPLVGRPGRCGGTWWRWPRGDVLVMVSMYKKKIAVVSLFGVG